MVQLKVTPVPLSTVVLDSEVRKLVLVGGSTRRKLTGFCMRQYEESGTRSCHFCTDSPHKRITNNLAPLASLHLQLRDHFS